MGSERGWAMFILGNTGCVLSVFPYFSLRNINCKHWMRFSRRNLGMAIKGYRVESVCSRIFQNCKQKHAFHVESSWDNLCFYSFLGSIGLDERLLRSIVGAAR